MNRFNHLRPEREVSCESAGSRVGTFISFFPSVFPPSNVKVDVPNKFGFTALMVAAQRGYSRYGASLCIP